MDLKAKAPSDGADLPRISPIRRRRRRRILIGLSIVGAGLLLVAADLAWSVRSGSRAVATAREQLELGAQMLAAGDVSGARQAFLDAGDASESATSATSHPSIGAASFVPGLTDDVQAARDAAAAVGLAAEAGSVTARMAGEIGWNGGPLPGFAAGGKIDADLIEQTQPGTARASALLRQAAERVEPIDPSGLLPFFRDSVALAQLELAGRAEQAERLSRFVQLLPDLLGGSEPRTYLLVLLSPSDPRASGGYPGVYGLLDVDGEHLRLSELQTTSKIPPADPPVAAPPEVKHLYGPRQSLEWFWNTTYTPDFPTAARLMMRIYEAGSSKDVDGVIASDPTLMSYLLEAAGPVDVVDKHGNLVWPETITSANVQSIVGAETYMTTSQQKSDKWQVAIGQGLWDAVIERPLPATGLISALDRGSDGRNLKVYSADRQEQSALTDLDVAGEVRFADTDPPLVTYNGYTLNRAGYYATYDVQSESEIDENGDRLVSLRITITNDAPSGPPSLLLGRAYPGFPVGMFGTHVNVYLPPNGKLVSSTTDGELGVQFVTQEFDRPVVQQIANVPAGGRTVVRIVYSVPTVG